jgi:3-isopropylmalate/(R)-2-methylmalate dehydratase small subunit
VQDVITGTSFAVGDDVKALDIMPVRFKSSQKLDATELALATFADLYPDFAARAVAGEFQIIVAGHNFGGGGKTVEGPVFALRGSGLQIVIAESFARYFLRNAINNAFPILVCPGITGFARTGDRLQADLRTAQITNQTNGEVITAQMLSKIALDIIGSGGLVAYAKKRLAA